MHGALLWGRSPNKRINFQLGKKLSWCRSFLNAQSRLRASLALPRASPRDAVHGQAWTPGDISAGVPSAFCFWEALEIKFGKASYHGAEDGLHLIFLRLPETCYFARQAAVHEDLVGSQAFMDVTHLCQVLHARGNPLQHGDELGGCELSLMFLQRK